MRFLLASCIVCLFSLFPFALEKPLHNFNFTCDAETGAFPPHLNAEMLEKVYGKENLQDAEISLGEGETARGTVLFPRLAGDRVEILWKEIRKRRSPELVKIATSDNEPSHWRARSGIALSTTLKELEEFNGRPFTLTGFGWDYSGTVVSWEGGALEKKPEEKCRFVVRLAPEPSPVGTLAEDYTSVTGDRDFSSRHPAMQRLNPKVYYLGLHFGE